LAISGISMQVRKIDTDLHNRLEKSIEGIRQLFAQTDKMDKKILEGADTEKFEFEPKIAIVQDTKSVPLAPILKEFVNQNLI
jgi:hypothetical protein